MLGKIAVTLSMWNLNAIIYMHCLYGITGQAPFLCSNSVRVDWFDDLFNGWCISTNTSQVEHWNSWQEAIQLGLLWRNETYVKERSKTIHRTFWQHCSTEIWPVGERLAVSVIRLINTCTLSWDISEIPVVFRDIASDLKKVNVSDMEYLLMLGY